MGEIAEMMLDGTLCQYCGEYLGSDMGFPQSCGCDDDRGKQDHDLYIVDETTEIDEIKDALNEIQFNKYNKGRRDKKGQLMIGLKNQGENAGLFIFKNEKLYNPALQIIRERINENAK